MSTTPFRRDSYRNPNGVRPSRTPGMGMGTGQGREEPDFLAFAAEHFPNEIPHRVKIAAQRVYVAKRRNMPTPDEVWAELQYTRTTKAQIEARFGEGTH